MLYFRLYFISSRTGHIMRFAEYEAPDDEAALALASEHQGAHALELWCGRRKVARMEPTDPASRIVARWRLSRAPRTESSGSES